MCCEYSAQTRPRFADPQQTYPLHQECASILKQRLYKANERASKPPACTHLHPYPLCFDMLHKNTRGGVVAPLPTLPSRFGTKSSSSHNEAEGSREEDGQMYGAPTSG